MNRSRHRIAAAALGALVATSSFAGAATRTWDGGASDNVWSNNINWAFNLKPGIEDDAVIPDGFPLSITFSGAESAKSVHLDGNHTLGAGTLTLGGTGGVGAITVPGVASAVVNTTLAGSAGLTKEGTGTLSLGAASSFSGNISVNGGTLRINGDNMLPNRPLSVAGGAMLDLNGFLNFFSSASGTGNISLGVLGTLALETTGSATFGGTITGAGGVAKLGTGTQRLTGNNTHTIDNSIFAGTLAVSANNNLGDLSAEVNLFGGTLSALSSFSTARAFNVTVPSALHAASGAELTITSPVGASATLTKSGPGTVTSNTISTISGLQVKDVVVSAGTLKTLGARASTLDSVTVVTESGAEFDVNNGGLILKNDTVANVRSLLIAGSGGAGFGAQTWAAPGINSTAAQADTLTRAVGYMDNDNFILGPKDTFDGVSVPGGSILVKSTLAGDADLDQDVDDDDVTVLGLFYGGTGAWYEGDFDYTGTVDDDDVTIIGLTYGQSLPGAPAGVSAVPEPGSLAMLGIAAAGLLRRRRRI